MDREHVDVQECSRLGLYAIFSYNRNRWQVDGIIKKGDYLKTKSIEKKLTFYKKQKVLNLFIALLLSSFDIEKLKEKKDEVSKIQEAFQRIFNAFKWIKRKLCASNVNREHSRTENINGNLF